MSFKKIVVFFPYGDEKGTIGQKVFEKASADNTERGYLVIYKTGYATKQGIPIEPKQIIAKETVAVFKDWVYWEKVE